MAIGDPQDGFSYHNHTRIMDSYFFLTRQCIQDREIPMLARCCQNPTLLPMYDKCN